MKSQPEIPELEGLSRRHIAFIVALILLLLILIIGAYLIQQGAPPNEPIPPVPENHMSPF